MVFGEVWTKVRESTKSTHTCEASGLLDWHSCEHGAVAALTTGFMASTQEKMLTLASFLFVREIAFVYLSGL